MKLKFKILKNELIDYGRIPLKKLKLTNFSGF